MSDRPYPVDCEHRGVKARIEFKWGPDGDPIPRGLKIIVEHKENPVIASREDAKYSSFEQARDHGIELAKADIDRILGREEDV